MVAANFKPLNPQERENLISALRGNAEKSQALIISPKDTSFQGVSDEVTDDEVISCVKSVPCHY